MSETEFDRMLSDLTPENLARSQQTYVDIVAKYYGDPDFKAKVDRDPTGTLKAEGFEVPEGATVQILFNTENLVHIVLPAPREDAG